ncbi:hypothetical protein [Photobacterium profundum]|uniref:hypothetical protein n=1 Tax=Photobacterium profundum TaxID=74109 RepID=UPI000674BD28|nr:hypothetical protein [Photobacterium profundum]
MTDGIEKHQPSSLSALLEVFDRNIRRRLAVPYSEIPEKRHNRYHSSEDDLIELVGKGGFIVKQMSCSSLSKLLKAKVTWF